MTQSGASIEAILRLNVTPFETDMERARKLVTSFKRSMTSVGKNSADASKGINVIRMRYAGVMISGALAGLGRCVFAVTTANCSHILLSVSVLLRLLWS